MLIENNIQVQGIVEPFGGGMSVSLELVASGQVQRATVCERDPLVYAFWSAVQSSPAALMERIADATVDIETWHRMKHYLNDSTSGSLVDRAFAYLFLNRTCFSGIVTGGPIGGYEQRSKYKIDCRFYKDTLVERVRITHGLLDRFEITNGDALDLIRWRARPDEVWYIDPPYYKAGSRLYRYYYVPEEHRGLRDALSDQKLPWFLSYDNDAAIQKLYGDMYTYQVNFPYSVRNKQQRTELLISNHPFSLPNEIDVVSAFAPDQFDGSQDEAAIA